MRIRANALWAHGCMSGIAARAGLGAIPLNQALCAGLLTPPQPRPQVSLNRSEPLILETFGRAMCGVGRPAHNATTLSFFASFNGIGARRLDSVRRGGGVAWPDQDGG